MSFRQYSRVGGGLEAAVQQVIYVIVLALAPIWVPVALVIIAYLGFQEWRANKASTEVSPVLICKSIDIVLADKSIDQQTRINVTRDYATYGCAKVKR